jgi:hypothetical protein
MCGGSMHLKEIVHATQVPGQTVAPPNVTREWSCPECDYFEEAEEEPT